MVERAHQARCRPGRARARVVFTPTHLIERESVAAHRRAGVARTERRDCSTTHAMTTIFVSHPRDKLDVVLRRQATARAAGARRGALQLRAARAGAGRAGRGRARLRRAHRLPPDAPAPEALFRELPSCSRSCRCAVDIRTVDVAAASAHGVLVTQASAGLSSRRSPSGSSRVDDRPRRAASAAMPRLPRAAGRRRRSMGRELRGATLGVIGYGQIGQLPRRPRRWPSACACCATTPQPIDDRDGPCARCRSPRCSRRRTSSSASRRPTPRPRT